MATTATSTSTATATVTSVATSTSTATTTTTTQTQTQTHDDYNTRCNENSNGGDDVDGNDDETATTATAATAATAAATRALAKEIAEQIHSSADILLEKLFSHLSKLPEVLEEEEEIVNDCTSPTTRTCTSLLGDSNNDTENDTQLLQRGITIPVSAVAWLSGQFLSLIHISEPTRPC